MKNLLCLIPSFHDATSFYRAAGPIGRIRKVVSNVQFNFINEYNWATLHMCDALFVQRPFKEDHVKVIEMAKNQGLKVWVDYDDDLFTVPTDNPASGVYNEAATKKAVAKCIAMADEVTVTTPFLKKRFQEGPVPLNKNITVIPNAFDFEMFNYRDDETSMRNKIMLWRGSITHERDLTTVAKEVINIAQDPKCSEWLWRFVGYNPWFITDKLLPKQYIHSKSLDIMEYNRHIFDIAPQAIFVPLHDSVFNRSKSNIAWFEGTLAGAVCIAPNWEEWTQPGIINYDSPRNFEDIVKAVMGGQINLEKMVTDSWNHMKENFDIRKVNRKRIEVIERLMGEKI